MAETVLPDITGIVVRVRELDAQVPYAHITLLTPFGADGGPSTDEMDDLEAFFAEVAPFEFRLTGESRFPDGPRYWCPEPAAHFRRLTHELHRVFPEYRPVTSAFEANVPHLSIPDDALAFTGELRVLAREATLLRHDEAGFHELRTFALGTSAA